MSPSQTTVGIDRERFLINDAATLQGGVFEGRDLVGLLPNARMIQGIFDDLNPVTRPRWNYPDGRLWDAEKNTTDFIRMLPTWKRCGLLAFTIGMQGGSPEGYSQYQPWINSAFAEDGSLREDYMVRLRRVLCAADSLGMAVIVSLFYYAQVPHLKNEYAVTRAVDCLVDWLLACQHRNVLIEVANESNSEVFHHDILFPHRVMELVRRVQDRSHGKLDTKAGRLLASTSFLASHNLPDEAVGEMDFILLHGNDAKSPDDIRNLVRRVRSQTTFRGQPVLFNEDDHFDFGAEENHMLAALDERASWGYFDFRRASEGFHEGYQSMPCSWEIDSERKRGFFNLLARITTGRG